MSRHHRGVKGEMKRVLAEAEALGYQWEIARRSCHIRYTHDELGLLVFGPGTPSDHRSIQNCISQLRRAVRQAEANLAS